MNAKLRPLAMVAAIFLVAAGVELAGSGAAQAASGGGCSGYSGVTGLPITFNSCISANGVQVIISSNVRGSDTTGCFGETTLIGQNGGTVWSSGTYSCTSGNHSWNTGNQLGTYRTEACYYNSANASDWSCLISPTLDTL